ncbi:TolC family protein [Ralstonia sp.]|jgi:outer membrane protein, heavy metal efflux system|uniref:TolC family protein n=1 Tax=Ralstonia sp. TaxID=54061 RepID=UPI00076AC1E6|nr:TolC family protein [Ralstonia sp.]MBA4280847.1 TolC family protein [Ralstonia sp.]
MRLTTLVLTGALAMLSWPVLAQVAPLPTTQSSPALQTLSLADALRLAEEAHPALRAKQAQLAAAEGARADASGLLFNNPQLSVDRTRRDVPQPEQPTEKRREWSTGISQTLEIAGQHGYRRAAAESGLVALRAEIEDVRRQVRVETAQQFYRVLTLQQRIAVEEQALTLFESTAAAVQKRRLAGEDTKLDANVAAVEAERARNQLAQANEQLLDARSELSAKLQLSPERLPQASGDVADLSAPVPYTLEALLALVDARPRLQALAAREDSARAKLRLEQASRYPDVTVGVNVGREGPGSARERVTTVSISVPLPLFKRNASGIGQARSELDQAEIERSAAVRDAYTQVRILWAKLDSLHARLQRLQGTVLPALADNQQLSLKSQRAGQIGLLELIIVNRQALDARRDLLEALAEYQTTRLALELASGWPAKE